MTSFLLRIPALLLLLAAAPLLAAGGGAAVVEGRPSFEELQKLQARVIAELKQGNEAFRRGPTASRLDASGRWKELAKGQNPKAMVLSCADSRVPPEIVFHADPGDLYVNRVAGNVVNPVILGSLEYGAEHLGIPVLVVLGHESCGAVEAALAVQRGLAEPDSFNITELLKILLRPAAKAVKTGLSGDKLMHRAVRDNVRNTLKDIQTLSPVLWERNLHGKLALVGAVYSLRTGEVEWLDD